MCGEGMFLVAPVSRLKKKENKYNWPWISLVYELTSNTASTQWVLLLAKVRITPTLTKKNSPKIKRQEHVLRICLLREKPTKKCFATANQTNNPTDTNKLESTQARAIPHITSVLEIPIENNKDTKMRSELRNAWILTIPMVEFPQSKHKKTGYGFQKTRKLTLWKPPLNSKLPKYVIINLI